MNNNEKIANVQWTKGHPYVRFQHRGHRVSEPCHNEFFKARNLKGSSELATRAARMIEILRGEIDQQLDRGANLCKSSTLGDSMAAYLSAREAQPLGIRPGPQQLDRMRLGLLKGTTGHPSFAAFLGESKKLTRVTCTDLEHYQRMLEDRDFAADSIRSWLSDIRAFLTWCQREGMLAHNPIRPGGFTLPSAGGLNREELPYSDLELARVAGAIHPDSALERFWRLAELTGARRSEVLRIRFGDFAESEPVLEIQGAAKNTQRRIRPRLIPVHPALGEFVRALNGASGAYVCSLTETPWGLDAAKSALRRASRRSGITISPQRMRRTVAQRLRDAGESRELIAEILGNSVRVLDRWYVHPTAPKLSAAGVQALGTHARVIHADSPRPRNVRP